MVDGAAPAPLPSPVSLLAECCPMVPLLRRLGPAVAGLAFLAAAGCAMPGLAWLPDSSGFIFTDKKGARVVHYDLKKKARRVVVADTSTRTVWPAVSPDGKQVAVARGEALASRPSQLQVTLYRLDGKGAHRSKGLPWKECQTNAGEVAPTFLFWARVDKVLVFTGEETAIYDPFHNTLVRVNNCMPWPIGNNPVRPDGEGFLASARQGASEAPAFGNWAGQVRYLGLDPPSGKGLEQCEGLTWDRAVATLRTPAGAYRLDTAKLAWKRDENDRLRVFTGGDQLEAAHTFPRGSVFAVLKNPQPPGVSEQTRSRIEFQDPRAGTRRVLVARTETTPWAFPSPDRKVVALHYGRGDELKILVVDSAGRTVANLEVE